MASGDGKESDPLWLRVFFGGTSCAIATVVTNPIDVIKVQMQISSKSRSKGMVGTALAFARTEGLLGLWNGLGPSLARAYVYTGSRLGFYGPWKKVRLCCSWVVKCGCGCCEVGRWW
jgi:hypothetical protein